MRHVAPGIVVEAEGVRTIHGAPLARVSMGARFRSRVRDSQPAHVVVFVTAIEPTIIHVLRVSYTTGMLVEIVIEVFVVLRGAEAPAGGPQTVVIGDAQVAAIAVAHYLNAAERAIGQAAGVGRNTSVAGTSDASETTRFIVAITHLR